MPNYRLATQTTNNVTYTNNGNGTINLSGTANAYTQFIDSTSFTLPAGTYTICSPNLSGYITLNLRSTDGNTTYANTGNTTSKLYATFTLAEETEMKFRVVVQNTAQTNVSIMPMILSGEFTTIPTYEPYGSGNWYKKEYIGKIQLTSGLTWAVSGSGYWYYISNYQSTLVKEANSDIISNYFTKGSWGTQSTNTICLGNSNSGVVGISKASFSTLEELKTFLNNNNVYAYAPLQVATDIEITNETLIQQLDNLEKLKSYNGVTNISSSGNLPMILNVSAIKGE